jgi:hypothetical protein
MPDFERPSRLSRMNPVRIVVEKQELDNQREDSGSTARLRNYESHDAWKIVLADMGNYSQFL